MANNQIYIYRLPIKYPIRKQKKPSKETFEAGDEPQKLLATSSMS